MSLKIKAFVFVALVTCVCVVSCKRSTSRGRGTYWGRSEQSDASSTYPHNQEHELQNAPPHRQTDVAKGSAPTAFENRYQMPNRDESTNKQSMNSPNPQRPTGWKSGSGGAKNDWNVASTRFNHPHFQTNKNDADDADETVGSYNYYGVGNIYNYGSVNNDEPFKGYSHVGSVPIKNALAGFGNKSSVRYRYGTGGLGFTNNAYHNVLVGLVTWHFMNTIGKTPHAIYDDFQNNSGNVSKNLSIAIDEVAKCPDNAEMLCEVDATALCTSDDRILCHRTQFCDDSANRCVNKNKGCENECSGDVGDEKTGSAPHCVAKARISGNLNASDLSDSLRKSSSGNGDITLCVTTIALRPTT